MVDGRLAGGAWCMVVLAADMGYGWCTVHSARCVVAQRNVRSRPLQREYVAQIASAESLTVHRYDEIVDFELGLPRIAPCHNVAQR